MDFDHVNAQLAAHITRGRVCVTCGPVTGKRCKRWAEAHARKAAGHLTGPLTPPHPGRGDTPRPRPEGQGRGDDTNEPGG